MNIEETARFTNLQIAEQVAAVLGEGFCVVLEPHFGNDGNTSHFGPLATVRAVDEDNRTIGFPNEAIFDAEQALRFPLKAAA